MKVDQKKVAIFLSLIMILSGIFIVEAKKLQPKKEINVKILQKPIHVEETIVEEPEIVTPVIVYENMTMEQLSQKLEKSMNSSLKGKGELFATYSIELGLDPYLALAIVLHETGCAYECSSLVKYNNNIGGLKASNGKYMSFKTLDEGIKGYLNILYKNYYSKGLTTPELMNPKYAASKTWASRVNWYIEKIKAK